MIKFLEGTQNIAAIVGITALGVLLVGAAFVAVLIGNMIVKQFEGVEE